MSLSQLFQLIESLPPALQAKVASFALGLKKEGEPQASPAYPTIRWADQPDPQALFGLTQQQPLDLGEIRKKAWKR